MYRCDSYMECNNKLCNHWYNHVHNHLYICGEGTCALIKSNVMCINIRDTRRLKLEKLGECVSNRYEVNVDTGKEI